MLFAPQLHLTTTYTTDGGGDTSWADAGSVSGDVVLGQVEDAYDADGNVLEATTRQRFHDETGTGALGTPSFPFDGSFARRMVSTRPCGSKT